MSESSKIVVGSSLNQVEADQFVLKFERVRLTRQAFCVRHGSSLPVLGKYRNRRRTVALKMRGGILRAILWLPLVASIFYVQAQTANELTPPRSPIPSTYFGLHIHHLWRDPIHHQWNDAEWPTIPFGTWRLWDSHTMWVYLEPGPGKYDFAILDRYVQEASTQHVQLVLTLQGTPTWASASPLEIPMHQGGVRGPAGSASIPQSMSTWEDFVRTVAKRYEGKIRYYEIWNEPMFKPYFSGTPQDMVRMVQTAAWILKQVDPGNKVLSPPVSDDELGLSWLKKFLIAGGGKYIDIWSIHFYVNGPPESAVAKVHRARELLRSYGQDVKPMWNTEAGWYLSHMDSEMAADYVARALLLGWPSGLGRYIFYSWDHDQMGIAPNGASSTPMVRAYATAEHWLSGSIMTSCIEERGGLWIENLTLPNGVQGKVVWSMSGPIPLRRDHIGAADKYVSLDGAIHAIPNGTILRATGSPILLYYGNLVY